MKNLLLIAIIVLGFSAASFGQTTSTNAATATATLVRPLLITKSVDMNFGTLASSGTIGTATLTTGGEVSSDGGVRVMTGGDPTTAAEFDVEAPINVNITYTLPEVPLTLTDGAGHDITLTAFSSTPTSGSNSGATGEYTIQLGASLSIPANSVAGEYKNTTDIKVTVDYE